jgi:beta-lactamase class C
MLYSNLGFAALGMAMASYEETPLFQVMQSAILQPLNMKNSFLTIPANKMKSYAQGYTAKGTPSRSPNGGLLAGSWAMKSSVADMGQYLCLALGLDNMPPKMVAAMKIAQTGYFEYADNRQIGFAWMIQPLDKINAKELLKIVPIQPRKRTEAPVSRISSPEYIENALIEKTGSTNGFRAYIGVIPEQKIGIVILVNRFIYDSNAVKHAGRQLLLSN